MSREYNYPTEEELEDLISAFIDKNNLDAIWLYSSEGYLGVSICHKVEDED